MISARACAILVVVPLLGLAACGGSSKKVDPAADLALAKRAVLVAADLPGYKGSPHNDSNGLPDPAKKDFATCMKISSSIFDDKPGAQKVDSQDFDKGDAEVQNTVEIDPKKSDVDTGWKQIAKPDFAPCLQKLFEAAIAAGAPDTKGVTFSAAKITRFDVGVGSRSVGYALNFSASSAGQSATFTSDLVFVQRDRAELSFLYLGTGSNPDRKFETGLVQKVYDRVGDGAK